MRRIYLLLLTGLLFATVANAQVTTNSGSGLNPTYPDLATAITALNAATITSPVVITLTGNETAPVGGYAITQLGGTITNTITIQGSGSTITAGLQAAGTNNDAIFKIIGGDWITIQSFTMQENAGNTVVATGATNTMTEWGVALLRASTTDGAQNNTIQNNIISLNRTYPNSWAIYSNVRHDAITPTTSLDITAATGANNGNKVYGNVISNVNYGIVFVGSGGAGFMDVGNDIGGASGATGNTLTNWGSNTVNSGFTSVSGTMWGIFVNQQTGVNVSYNSLTSATGIAATTLRGIFNDFSVLAPTGTFTNSITNNTITLNSANTTGTFEAIRSQGLTALSTATININANTILNCVISGAASSSGLVCIANSSAPGVLSMSNNIIQGNTSTATTGGFTGITNTGAVVTTLTMNNNQIGNATGNAITFSAATSGTVLCISSSGGAATCSSTIQSNDIRGIVHSVGGTSTHTYISQTGTPLNCTINLNTFTNLNVNTTGTTKFIIITYSATTGTQTKTITNNSIVTAYNRSGASGAVTLVDDNGSSVTGTISNCQTNNFSNITLAGSSSITGLNYTDGGTAPTRTVSGNTLNNWTGGTGTINTMNFTYWNGVSSLSTNTITNITGQGTVTGITIGSTVNSATSITIATNIITGLSSTGTGGSVTGISCSNTSTLININGNTINTLSSTGASSTIVGIAISGATTTNVFQNTINTLSGSGATAPTANGISVSSGTTVNVSKNKIYDLFQTAAGGIVNGMLISGGTTVTASNNLIGDLRATAATGLNAINGINITGSTTSNIYYNSVYLNATSSSATTFGNSCITFATTPVLNLRNNILVNVSTPAQNGSNLAANGIAAALRRASGTAATVPANYAATSNNNLFWANPTAGTNNHLTYVEGTSTLTNPFNTFASFKTFLVSRDQQSVTEDLTAAPTFLSTAGSSSSFLHISTSVATQVESGAAAIGGITDDYDGDTRNVSTPDIGADEGTFTLADLTGPAISYTALGNVACTSDRTFTATITDASNVNTTAGTKPRLYFKKSTDANNYVGNTSADNGWKYVEATNAASPFSFTTNFSLLQAPVATADIIQYFVVAQDLAGTPNVSINTGTFAAAPASVALTTTAFPVAGANSFTIIPAGISGTVSVGAAQTYHSLTEAGAFGLFNTINTGGLSGNLIVNIVDASVTETGATALNAINYNGCVAGPYTVTIKPSATSTLTGTVASGALIKLNGATNVTIDGSNSGGTDRSLTITNSGTSSPTAVSLVSLGTGLGASNNTIKNCNLSTGISTGTGYGIAVGGSTPGTSGADNDNVTLRNNSITVATVSIYAVGTASVSTGGMDNLLIINNSINSNSTLQNQGIQVGNGLNGSITGNTISVQSSGGVQPVGISLETGFVSSTVTNNFITNVLATNTGGYGGRGITVGTGTASSNLTIANNVIYGVNGSNYSSFTNSSSIGIGIGMVGGSSTLSTTTGGVNIYFNSVNMYGTYSYPTNCITAALYIGSGASALNIKNNAFVNSLNNTDGSGTASKNYAVYSAAANTAFTNINYNDYFASGTQGVLGFLTADQATIAAWKIATTQDVNSISADPLFGTPTVLQPSPGSPLVAAATPIAGITTDISAVVRNVTTPTIGAYELAGDFIGPNITYATLGGTLCATDRTLSPVTITDASGVNITAGTRPRLYFKKSTEANTYAGNTSGNNGWKYVEATGAGGSPFSFTTNYSLLTAPVAPGDIIQYFVVAQDLATPNVTINSGTFAVAPASVALTAAAFPVSGTVNQYSLLSGGLAADVTIGAAGTYTSLTKAGGLFSVINAGGITANINATILDASVAEDGTFALNSINYGCAGSYTLTIKPAASVNAVLTGSSASALVKLNGADNVIIDGSNNGSSSKNLTITNTNTGTASAVIWIASASASDGATNNIVKNTIITGNAATTTFAGIFSGGTASIGISGNALTPNSGNTIQNDSISKSQFGIYVIGVGTGTLGTGLTISGNSLGSSTTGDGFSAGGISVKFQTGALISGNNVQNIVGTSGFSNLSGSTVMAGIHLESVTSSSVLANKIHFMNYNGTSVNKVYGLNTETSTFNNVGTPSSNTYANNIVYDLVSSGASGSWNTSGINNNGGYNDKYYFNSVYLTGQMSGTGTAGSAAFSNGNGISSVNCPVIDLRNNVFYMNGSSGAAATLYSHYTTLTAYTGSTLNYNDLLSSASGSATAQLGFFNSASVANIAAWQTATTQEANSIGTDPLYPSGTILQPLPGSPLLAAGTAIAGITTDITGVVRSVVKPTIGAYELTGDFTGPTITYTPLSNTLCATNITLTPVAITDGSGVNITAGTRPRLYFKKSTDANTYAGNTSGDNGWKYVEATGAGGSPFSFTTNYSLLQAAFAPGDIIQYFVVAQDLAGPPNVSINSGIFAVAPASVALTAAAFPLTGTINSYTLSTGLSADVTIGAAGTYTSLTNAGGLFSVINAGGLSANINATILDASVAESGTNALNSIAYGCSGSYTLTIKPASGVTTTLTGSSASAIIKLNGADNVIINGSNNGSTSKDMTITNTNIGTSSVVVWLASTVSADGATNNTIKNCIITGNASTTTLGCITESGSVIGTAAEAANSNNTYQNNTMSLSFYGIAIVGPSALESGTVITQNTIGTPTNAIGFRGMHIANQTGATVTANTVQNVVTTSSSTGAGGAALVGTNTGVNVSNNTFKNISSSATSSGTSSVTALYIGATSTNTTVNANNITGIASTTTSGYGVRGIIVLGNGTVISNNFLSDIYCYQDLSNLYWPIGIDIDGASSGVNVWYNSVNLFGSHTGYSSNPTDGGAAALFVNSSGTNIDVRNNLLSNTYDNNTSTGDKSYAIYSSGASGAQFSAIDNNDYWVSGTPGVLGFLLSDQLTLATIQTAFGGNTASQNGQPAYTSPIDLHLLTPNSNNFNFLESKGVVVAVTTDIDAQARPNGTAPDIGADEFVGAIPSCITPIITSISGITTTAAVVNFNCPSCPGSYVLEYGVATPNWSPGTAGTAGSGSSLVITGASSPISLAGLLTPGTSYKVYVRQFCGGVAYSFNSDSVLFSTPCLATSIPYLETFDAVTAPAVPTCITIANPGNNNAWRTVGTDLPVSAPNIMRLDFESDGITPADDWFFTQGLNLTGSTSYRLRFQYRNSDGVTYPEKMEVKYGNGNNSGAMTSGTLFTNTSIINDTWVEFDVDFTPSSTGVYYIGFHGFSDPNEAYLAVDNVNVILTPSCIPPTDVTVTAVTGSSATISFTSPGTSFYVEYGPVGFTPGAGATAGGGTMAVGGPFAASPVVITGLAGTTTYDVYVRRDCGAGSYSPNTLPVTLTTGIGNDDAPGALSLTVGAGCTGASYTNVGASAGAGEPFPSCSGTIATPVWFKFVAPAGGAVRISTDVGSGNTFTDSKIALFSTTNVNDYTTFNIIGCDDDGGSVLGSFMSVVYATGLTPGTTYYIAVDKYSIGTTSGTFCIAVDALNSTMLASANTCTSSYQTPFGSNTNYAGWVSLLDANSKLVALVKNQIGTTLSSYSVAQNINTAAVRTDVSTSQRYLDRNFRITNGTAVNDTIQLFFLTTELTALQAADSAVTLANLGVTHQTEAVPGCYGDFLASNGTNTYLSQTASGTSTDGSVKWVQVTTPSFSNFYLHTSRAPVTMKTFLQGSYNAGTLIHNQVTAQWVTVLNAGNYPAGALSQPYSGFGHTGTEHVNAGYFVATGGSTDVLDWVLLELRSAAPPAAPIATRAAFIREDGAIVDLDGVSSVGFRGIPNGSYYVTIRHRNHLGIRTALVQLLDGALGSNPTPAVYDFSTSLTQAFKDVSILTNEAMAHTGSAYLMWAGNANQDNFVRATSSAIPPIPSDAAAILTILGGNPNATGTVYSAGDVNMDGRTRATSSAIPPIPSDAAFILSSPLGGNNNATRKEHK